MTAAPLRPPSRDFSDALAADLLRLAVLADADAVVLRLADTLACALGAEDLADTVEGTVTRVRRARFPDQGGGATVWWSGEAASTDAAAFRNAVAARYLDYNDTYVGRAIVHPSDLIPALVALAEERRVAWDRLIEAVSVAYEVLCRIADHTGLRQHGFDGSTLTPIGTAAGAGWLMGLDEPAAAEALRIASLDAGTLRAVRLGKLSDWKAVASGRGAIKGLFAARMAEAGCRAPESAFDGPDGFAERIGGKLGLAADDNARLPRTILKAYPVQIFIQGLIGLAQSLRPRVHENLDSIQSIHVATFRQAVDMVGGHGHPRGAAMNRENADHSAPFAIAAILVTGRLRHEDYEALLEDDRVIALMGKITVEEDAEASGAFPELFPAKMRISLADGETYTAGQSAPSQLQPAGLADKFAQIWPASIPREWRWELPGEAPRFPVKT